MTKPQTERKSTKSKQAVPSKEKPGAASQIDGRSLRAKTGRSSNPDYTPIFVMVKKTTKNQLAKRLLDIEPQRSMSELVELLIEKWLKEK
jgi:hypothetical protein